MSRKEQQKQNEEALHEDEKENLVDDLDESGHNPVDAEKQSYDSVDKTDDGTKRQPKRKGDKENSQKSELKPAPKTRTGIIHDMYDMMKGMSKEDLAELHKLVVEEDFDTDAEAEAEDDLELNLENNYSEDLNALVEGEATLSEEFKAKAGTIFEAAVNSRVAAKVRDLEKQFGEDLAEELDQTRSEMVEKIDSYLDYVVEQYLEDNKLAVETGIRAEIAENFMAGLKSLFEESYIEVPESKVDLVDEMAEQVSELEGRLNTVTEQAIVMGEELEGLKRERIIHEMSEGLADTQVEKLATLTEDLDFEDEETFAEKVKTVKESYFTKSGKQTVNEDFDSEEGTGDSLSEDIDTDSVMGRYLSTLRKNHK